MKKKLIFEVEVDKNNLPVNIEMQSNKKKEDGIKALIISAWSAKSKETLRVDLWTKDMPVDEMKLFFHQTLTAMSDTFMRATQDEKMTATMKDFCAYFAEKLDLKQN